MSRMFCVLLPLRIPKAAALSFIPGRVQRLSQEGAAFALQEPGPQGAPALPALALGPACWWKEQKRSVDHHLPR